MCGLAGSGSIGAASISPESADIARVSAIKNACDKQSKDPYRQAHEGKRHQGTNNHFRHDHPDSAFLRLNQQLVEQKGAACATIERPVQASLMRPYALPVTTRMIVMMARVAVTSQWETKLKSTPN